MTRPAVPEIIVCPICSAPWRGGSNLCASCGADLDDPDVRAFAGLAAPTSDSAVETLASELGVLGAGKLLGVSRDGLRTGSALRRLGLIGGVMLAVAFVLPAERLWRWLPPLRYGDDRRLETTLNYAWDLLAHGPAVALLVPLLAALVGLVVAWAPGIPTQVRAWLLAATGLLGLALCLGPLGVYALAPTEMLTLTTLGVIVAGTAVAARVLDPQSMLARYALIAGAVLFAAGLLVPTSNLTGRVHEEFTWLHLDGSVPLLALLKGFGGNAGAVYLVAGWMLAPLALVPAAALLSWKRPRGIWDKDGLALRPLAWALLLYLPIYYALLAFAGSGWENQELKSAVLGRMRLIVIAAPLVLWVQFGIVGAMEARRKATS